MTLLFVLFLLLLVCLRCFVVFCALLCFVGELWLVQIIDMALFNAQKQDLLSKITE